METLISVNVPCFLHHSGSSNPQFSCIYRLSQRNLYSSAEKCNWRSKKSISCPVSASSDQNFTNFGGWDDLELSKPSSRSGKFDRFQNFLVSVGIDERKHFFLFFLGFICALAISKFRCSSWAVFPVSIFVFVAGFWVGIVRSDMDNLADKIRSRDREPCEDEDSVRVSADRVRKLGNLLSDLDVKVSDLKNGMEGTINSNCVDMGEIRSFLDSIKSVHLAILPVKTLFEKSIDNDSINFCSDQMLKPNGYAVFLGNVSTSNTEAVKNGSDNEIERNSTQKPSRRRRHVGFDGFDFIQLVRNIFQDSLIGTNPQRSSIEATSGSFLRDKFVRVATACELQKVAMQDCCRKQEFIDNSNPVAGDNQICVDQNHENMVDTGIEEMDLNPETDNDPENNIKHGYCPNAYQDQQKEDGPYKNLREVSNQETLPLKQAGSVAYVSALNNRAGSGAGDEQSQRLSLNGVKNSQERLKSSNPLVNNEEILGNSIPTIKGKQFIHSTRKSYAYDVGSCKEDMNKDNQDDILTSEQGYLENLDCESKNKSQPLENDQPNRRVVYDTGGDDESLFSMISDDNKFNKQLEEGTHLLKRARECLIGRADEERAEMILYKSASLLSRAAAARPTNLLAVGQLGNALLLHGELKLKISHELRSLLERNNPLVDEKGYKLRVRRLDDRIIHKDKVALVLADVCEECEELLVEAGRKYRMALSIDGDDVRALYNWGLALSFRAQLIADSGPEAAYDADKVYLAAIDKFDAMMARSNTYAPDALFRWGVVLQQRSRLRPSSSKEKIKLLQQAQRLFEDALNMDSSNVPVREALSSCLSELNYRHF